MKKKKLGMKSLEKFYLFVVLIYIGFKIYGQIEFNFRMVSTWTMTIWKYIVYHQLPLHADGCLV